MVNGTKHLKNSTKAYKNGTIPIKKSTKPTKNGTKLHTTLAFLIFPLPEHPSIV
jgi:hypothetical protein